MCTYVCTCESPCRHTIWLLLYYPLLFTITIRDLEWNMGNYACVSVIATCSGRGAFAGTVVHLYSDYYSYYYYHHPYYYQRHLYHFPLTCEYRHLILNIYMEIRRQCGELWVELWVFVVVGLWYLASIAVVVLLTVRAI